MNIGSRANHALNMVVWIQKNTEGYCSTHSVWLAYDGFAKRSFECKEFQYLELLNGTLSLNPEEDIVCGGVLTIHLALKQMGYKVPDSFDYPKVLEPFFGRKIKKQVWSEVIDYIAKDEYANPIFVKPCFEKVWTGRVIGNFLDLIKIGNPVPEYPVWVSEPINFESEFRVMVLNDQPQSVRFYKGNVFVPPSENTINEMVEAMRQYEIAAYSLDVGVVNDQTCLVEVNDSYALGSYGPESVMYSKMIEARWKQLRKNKV